MVENKMYLSIMEPEKYSTTKNKVETEFGYVSNVVDRLPIQL